jgi:hypothetical protein
VSTYTDPLPLFASLTSNHSEGVPDSEKSTGQKLADQTGREKDHHKEGGGGIIDKTKDALGMNK